ncbi:Tudor-like, plant [Corchorus olitorius]|uniref:Tudor-like, plant n=1 Tax=Corchorus olitorius TaxID=93759 RepID=A0A1R3J6D8_9ROSI|nr:Tudor-like, plant [Corchorus olitorius]
MAVVGVLDDKGSVLRKNKRRKLRKKKKLDVDDKVEDEQGCRVKYDNILTDDSSDNLVETVAVPSLVDGIGCHCVNKCNYRGLLRPLPPKIKFQEWNLFYGLCVDVYVQEAWWEGVIFDHENGSDKRRVFFPDLGDEMFAEIGNIRITQDWDDFEEEWNQRGNWLFLPLIEEYQKEWYISVSVKQLWYDLREKKGFQNIRDWTCSCEALWKELVLEVIKDNHEITVNHFLMVSALAGSSQPECKSQLDPATAVGDVNLGSDAADLADTLALVPAENPINNVMMSPNSASIQPCQEKSDTGQSMDILKDDNNVLTECNGSSPDKVVCLAPEVLLVSPSAADRISCISSVTSTGGFSGTDSDVVLWTAGSPELNATSTWMTAGKDIVPKAEPCPDAITKYAVAGKKNSSLIIDARKHLLYLGWKIEFKRDSGSGAPRVRYISPAGQFYYSLYQLCLDLMEQPGKHISSNTKDLHVVKPKTRNLHVGPNSKEMHVVKPEYCPQAVLDWSKVEMDEMRKCPSRRSDMTLKVKKHLSCLGWTFQYVNCNGRRFLSYTSPRGKTYCSLRAACKSCLEEQEITQTDTRLSRHVEKINVVEDETQLPTEKLSSAHPKRKRKDNSSHVEKINVVEDETQLPTEKLSSAHPKRKRKDNSLHFGSHIGKRANSSVKDTSITRLKGGKSPAALLKLRENLKVNKGKRVLRSTKRVQQIITPSPFHKNPRTVLSWLMDNNVVLPRSKVHYWRKEQRLKFEGRLTRAGIKCACCDKVYTLGSFVAHAGSSTHSPAANIFLEDGRSLLDCELEMIHNNKMKKFEKKRNRQLKRTSLPDKNDCICSSVPDGDWFCPSCCCGICGESKAKEDAANLVDSRIITCAQCEHKYHAVCICSREANKLKILATEDWFCSKKCEEIFLGLHELLGRPIPVGTDNLTWKLIKSMDLDTHDLDASGNEAMVQNYSKLSIALDVMHECFEPVKEPNSGRDLVADIIFSRSSELNRINFRGFYTILLERHDELITVANVRFQYRRLGMCRILMNELEKNPSLNFIVMHFKAVIMLMLMGPVQSLKFDAGGQISGNENSVPIVALVNQPTEMSHEPCDSEVNPECSVEEPNNKEVQSRVFLTYKRRRRISACGS